MAQLMPLPLAVSCFSKIHIGFTFLGSPGKKAVKRVCVCVQYTLEREGVIEKRVEKRTLVAAEGTDDTDHDKVCMTDYIFTFTLLHFARP